MITAAPQKRIKKRLHNTRLEVSKETEAQLNKTMPKTTALTRTDVLRRAVKMYSIIIEQQELGWSVVLKKGTEEKPFPVN